MFIFCLTLSCQRTFILQNPFLISYLNNNAKVLTVAYTVGQNFKCLTEKRDLNLSSKLYSLTYDFYDSILVIVKSLLNHRPVLC